MAWIISIVLFGITSVFVGFYSGNWRNIQNTPWRLVKKIYDTYMMCYFNLVIGWRMQGWLNGQSHILKTAIMVQRKRLSRAITATFWPLGAVRPSPAGPECKKYKFIIIIVAKHLINKIPIHTVSHCILFNLSSTKTSAGKFCVSMQSFSSNCCVAINDFEYVFSEDISTYHSKWLDWPWEISQHF